MGQTSSAEGWGTGKPVPPQAHQAHQANPRAIGWVAAALRLSGEFTPHK